MKNWSRRWHTAVRYSISRKGKQCWAVRYARIRRCPRGPVARYADPSRRATAFTAVVFAAAFAGFLRTSAQVITAGQDVAPVFEGWEQNTDGTFNLVFGYFNRNWGEEVDIPIGSEN